MLRYLRAVLTFARVQAWVDDADWTQEDAKALSTFFVTPVGAKLRAKLLNMHLRQQSIALSKTEKLEYDAGYCSGQKGVLSVLDSLANHTQFPSKDAGSDPDLN